MQSQAELKVIVPEKSVWAQIMGWLPVVVIAGALVFVVNLIQSTISSSATKPAAKVVTAEAVEISYWPLWILALVVTIVAVVVWKNSVKLKEMAWWKDKDNDSKKLFWYIVVIFVAYAASGIAPEGAAIAFKGIAALVAVHFVWTLSPGKPNVLTWIVVGGMIIYFVLAWLVPPVVGMRDTSVKLIQLKAQQVSQRASEYVDNYEKCLNKKPGCIETASETLPTASRQPQAGFKTTSQVLHLVPGGIFQSVGTPPGARIIESVEWSCPQGCIREIEHDFDMLCTNWNGTEADENDSRITWHTGDFNGTPCRMRKISEKRYREQFIAQAGSSNNTLTFPSNLIGIISSFGTISEIGPVEVAVTIVTSS